MRLPACLLASALPWRPACPRLIARAAAQAAAGFRYDTVPRGANGGNLTKTNYAAFGHFCFFMENVFK